MKQTFTICPHCGCGCGLYLVQQDGWTGGVTASQEHYFSAGQLCARGWTGYQLLWSPLRIKTPLYKKNGGLVPIGYDKGLESAGKKLKSIKEKHGPQSIGIITSSRLTVEEAQALCSFAKDILETPNYDSAARLGYLPVEFPKTAVAADISGADLIIVLGASLMEENPVLGARVVSACKPEADRPYQSADLSHVIAGKPARLAVMDSRKSALTDAAELFLKTIPGHEAGALPALLKVMVEKYQLESKDPAFRKVKESLAKMSWENLLSVTGLVLPGLEQLGAMLASAKAPLVIFGRSLFTGHDAAAARSALAGLSLLLPEKLSVLQTAAAANDWGCARILTSDKGQSYTEMMESLGSGKIKTLLLVGEDPLKTLGGKEGVSQALAQAELVVAFDHFASESHQYAEAVFPLALSFEKEGSFCNLDGRRQKFEQAVKPDFEVMSLEESLKAMASVIGGKLDPKDELKPLVPAGWDTAFNLSKAAPQGYLLELGTAYPHLYGDDQLTFNSYHLAREFAGGFVELHPDDIKELGVRAGWKVKILSAAGSLVVTTRSNPDLIKKTAFMPAHFGGNLLALAKANHHLKTPQLRGIAVKIEKT
ncbi:molybdopterin-dependent oxidoreductase [candidate division TA06 bacterium]|uniref:Molybdopterin-dependent oxidoreductase n=1 Tax=candidate division TA06 bacterium TaxID=2250710 RepID=A0A933IFH6_UNCT6|nr:molybdopterin-dependent oxidoreductase [candidate division TA06 bacterium]